MSKCVSAQIELAGDPVHLGDETSQRIDFTRSTFRRFQATAKVLGKGHGRVVARRQEQAEEQLANGQPFSFLDVRTRADRLVGALGKRHSFIQDCRIPGREPQDNEGRHDLGRAGNINRLGFVVAVE